uniref:PH domain-containing protein n=1 Tax=Ficedula albicollis TaxID=59894 RepID=A0A803V7X8_FICAL
MAGWLFKWTNYIKGYQRRWFVLSNGLLSYYRYRGWGAGQGPPGGSTHSADRLVLLSLGFFSSFKAKLGF